MSQSLSRKLLLNTFVSYSLNNLKYCGSVLACTNGSEIVLIDSKDKSPL